LACLVLVWLLLGVGETYWLSLPVLSLFWWLLGLLFVISYPRHVARWSSKGVQVVIGLFILVPTWIAVVGLHSLGHNGPYLVLYLLSLIWIADSGAYFGGRSFGKHKLAPHVSPGKTLEGVLSAFLATAIYAILITPWFDIDGNLRVGFVVLSLVTVAFSILGDLSESMFKRHAGVKDSGNLLPGHGGVLDRIDSVTAAAPVFVVGLWLGGFNNVWALL
jgi:phosphatidate cytidylyltransferase